MKAAPSEAAVPSQNPFCEFRGNNRDFAGAVRPVIAVVRWIRKCTRFRALTSVVCPLVKRPGLTVSVRLSQQTKWFVVASAVLWAAGPLLFAQAFQSRAEYRALLEPVGKTINGAGQSPAEFANYWSVMKENEKPLVYMTYVGLRGVDKHWTKQLKADLLNYSDKFIIPQVGLSMTVDAQNHYEGDVAAGLLDNDIASFLDGLEELARPVYLRIGYEFNGLSWNGYLPEPYKQAFIRVTNKIRERNLEVATVWDAITDNTTNYIDYYPGDSYVDWFGINIFSDGGLTSPGTYAFLDLAASRRKPVMIGESTPQQVGVLDGQTSWNRWFAPYFNLIRSRPEIKMFCYINRDWSLYPQWSTWGDCRLEKNDYVKQQFSDEMDSPLYLHATTEKEFRGRLGYNDNVAPPAIAALRSIGASFPVTLQWDAATDASGIARYEVYRNGVLVGALVKPGFQDQDVEAGAHYQYRVKVFDRAGNESGLSSTLDVYLPSSLNKTINGEFDDGKSEWSLYLNSSSNAAATWEVDPGSVVSGMNSAHVRVTTSSGTDWHVQLRQPMKIFQGHSYLVTYKARADKNVSIKMAVQQDHAPNTTFLSRTAALTTSTNTFSATLVANTTDTVNLSFYVGVTPSEVWLDAVTVAESQPNVNGAPAIVTQPASQTLASGSGMTFSVVATGTAPLSYVWKKDGSVIASATNTSYAIVSAQNTDAGSYTVTVSNGALPAGVTSNAATLAVFTPPAITTAPASQKLNVGQSATFSVVATGSAPLIYVWKKGGAVISGATGVSYMIASVQTADAGSYTVTVSNAAVPAGVTSSAAILTVNTPPAITTQPASQTVDIGQSATFNVVVTGTPAPALQWRKDGVAIAGATAATLALTNLLPVSAGIYSVVATNDNGSATSADASLTVMPFSYRDIIETARFKTLSLFLAAKDNTTGLVSVNGVDTAQPTTAFRFDWGDGTTSTTWFPGTHTYSDTSRNYQVKVTAFYGNGVTDDVTLAIQFVVPPSPVLGPFTIPADLTVSVPTILPSFVSSWPGYGPPSLRVVPDDQFGVYSRSIFERVLGCYAVIQADLVNNDLYRPEGHFRQIVLAPIDPAQGGGFSLWYMAPPMFVGGNGFFGSTPDWSSMAHEMGHNATLNSPAAFRFGGNSDGPGSAIVSEGLAQIFAHVTAHTLINNAAQYGIPNDLAADIARSARITFGNLKAFTVGNEPIRIWDDPATSNNESFRAFMVLAYQFFVQADHDGADYVVATKRLMTCLQRFNPAWNQRYSSQVNSPEAEAFRASMMIAAVSYGLQKDLRATFRDLGFPVDDLFYTAVYNGQRDLTHIITSATDLKAISGQSFNYQIAASGSPTAFAVQGLPAGLSCAASTGMISGTTTQKGTYTLNVSASSAAGSSEVEARLVVSDVTITTQPVSQTLNHGQTVTFVVVAEGVAPLGYQWRKDGANITGATDASYSIPSVQPVDAGSYTVVVTKTASSATSDPAVLAIAHNADVDRDLRLSLIELTRVIELYNTRLGATRTGRYKMQAGTEDGFAQDTTATANQTLTRYHSADSNRNGQITVGELTRVIELYNARSGTVRTGQYHVQAGTEDGFAAGP